MGIRTRTAMRGDVDANDDGFDDLLALARRGDAGAWSQLYHQVAPVLVGYLRAQRLPDPEDVAGEVMLEVVRGLPRFSGTAAGFRSWVLAIAHHRLLDARRREARRPATPTPHERLAPPPSTMDDPETEALASLGFGMLEPALQRLTDDQRSVLLLRVIGDLPIAEVARITGRRPGAVKQLQRRAAAAMRRCLDAQAAQEAAADRPVRSHDRVPSAGGPADEALASGVGRTGRVIAAPGTASPSTWTT